MRVEPHQHARLLANYPDSSCGTRRVRFPVDDQYWSPPELHNNASRIEHIVRNTPVKRIKPAIKKSEEIKFSITPRKTKAYKRLKFIAEFLSYFVIPSFVVIAFAGPAGVAVPLVLLAVILICNSLANEIKREQNSQKADLAYRISMQSKGRRVLDLRGINIKYYNIDVKNMQAIDEIMVDKKHVISLLRR